MLSAAVRNHLPIALSLAFLWVFSPPTTIGQVVRLDDLAQDSRAVILVSETSTGHLAAAAGYQRAGLMKRRLGSLFKLPIAIALLRNGRFSSSRTYRCTGVDTIDGTRRTCWLHGGHGLLRFVGALAESCNLYFRVAAREVSRGEILRAAHDLGMYEPTEAPADADRSLPDDLLLEGATELTPLDLMETALMLATRGRLARGGARLDLASGRYFPLYRGLRNAVTRGTARGAWSRRFSVAGKTGTAELFDGGHRTVGWFVGFAPADRPRFAVVVAVDNARGFDAARIGGLALGRLL